VKVVVRCRPLNSKEKDKKERVIVHFDAGACQVHVSKPDGQPGKTFTFDTVFPIGTTQKTIWGETAQSIVDSVISGYNGTIFAYGQTGTGKTFTMEGVPEDENLRGIMPNAFQYIMQQVENAASNTEFLVRTSFLEIYNDQVYDLLGKSRAKMEVREKRDKYGKSEVFVKDLKHFVVKSSADMMRILLRGQKIRKVGATAMNKGSSRSHSIFTVCIESCEISTDGKKMFKVGKLNMVDLAGSERQSKTGATGDRLVEGNAINQSLSALGNVIKALVSKGNVHVPFRDSKLTRLLQNSLGGNTKTVMVANIGPAASNFDETINTLRYASRAKSIKNKPRVNQDPKDAMLKKCQDEIEALRKQLEAAKTEGGHIGLDTGGEGEGEVIEEIEEKMIVKEIEVSTGLSEEDKKKAAAEVLEKHRHQKKVDQEMARVIKLRKEGNEEAAKQLEEELDSKRKAIEEEKDRLDSIQKKLTEKTHLLMKGQKTLEAARLQRGKLKKAEEELRRRKQQEMKIKDQMSKAREKELLLEEQYANQQDELKKKTSKLKELFQRYREKQQDLADLQDEWEVERVDLVENIRELDQQLRLRDLILKHYIPERWIKEIEERSQYNEPTDHWIIPGLQYAANNIQHDDTKLMRHKANTNFARQLMRRNQGNRGQFNPMGYQESDEEEKAELYLDGPPPKKNPFNTYGVDIRKRRKKRSKGRKRR